MLLARVIGTVWATRKDEKLAGFKLQIVQHLDRQLKPLAGFLVAADSVGAGVGEVVLIAQGSSARQTALTTGKPVDAVIMAIVENLFLEDPAALEERYRQRLGPIQERLEALQEN